MLPRVLFVDDDQNMLNSYRRQFRRLFYVSVAESGEEALELIENSENKFNVVVSDYHMPGMDGLTFLSMVRERDPMAVLLVITGRADLQIAIQAVNEGFVFRFLTKPVSADELLPIIKKAYNEYRLNKMVAAEIEKAAGSALTLSMCSNCKRVRDPKTPAIDQANWKAIELFLSQKFGVDLSHGLCPECVKTLYGAEMLAHDDED